jgi:hypothetical protein
VIIRLILCSLICSQPHASAVSAPPRAPQEAAERPVVRIPASDVRHHTVIVGRLGLPLGTLLTIEETWKRDEQPKDIKSPNAPEEARKELVAGSQPSGATGSPRSGFSTEIKSVAPPAIRRRNAPGTLNSEESRLRTARLKSAVLEWSVLEAVCVDMIHRREARARNGSRNETIVFWTRPPGKSVAASWLIDREDPPSELSEVQVQRAVEAAKNAAWTQHERDFMESFRPKDERIVVLDDRRPEAIDEVRAASPGQVIRAHTPGFSKDKKFAIVQVQGDVSIHVEYLIYVLERQDGKWVVLARDLKFYP